MIVVIGSPSATAGRAAGLAADVARAIAGTGARVEIVGRVGDDAAGEELLLDLSRAGVGHVAVLRDPAHPTPQHPAAGIAADAADLRLALGYLRDADTSAILLVDPLDPSLAAEALEAARYGSARLVVAIAAATGEALRGTLHRDPAEGHARETAPPLVVEYVPGDPAAAVSLLVGLLLADD
ncbi:MAG: pfkB family carbohydrate kinase [Chloroflexota bacterium]